MASARDGRALTELTIAAWADDLSDISYEDALEAARDHYRQSTAWLMPVHIVNYVRAKKFAYTMSPDAPENCGNHRWTKDGTCAKCLAYREDPMTDQQWHAPGYGDGEVIEKPENFDDMVAAAAAATSALVEKGYSRDDKVVRDAAWEAADLARRRVQ